MAGQSHLTARAGRRRRGGRTRDDLDEVWRDAADERDVLGGVARSDTRFILPEGDVQDPAQAVLDPPVGPDDGAGPGRRRACEAAQGVAAIDGGFPAQDLAGGLDADEALEPLPLRRFGQEVEVWRSPDPPDLVAVVCGVPVFGVVVLDPGEVGQDPVGQLQEGPQSRLLRRVSCGRRNAASLATSRRDRPARTMNGCGSRIGCIHQQNGLFRQRIPG